MAAAAAAPANNPKALSKGGPPYNLLIAGAAMKTINNNTIPNPNFIEGPYYNYHTSVPLGGYPIEQPTKQQPQPQYFYTNQQETATAEQYYMRSLLDTLDMAAAAAAAPAEEPHYPTNQPAVSPPQVRYKYPKQQYQYLNASASPAAPEQPLDFHRPTIAALQRQTGASGALTGSRSFEGRAGAPGGRQAVRLAAGPHRYSTGGGQADHPALVSPSATCAIGGGSHTVHLSGQRGRQPARGTPKPTGSGQRSAPGSLKRLKSNPLSSAQHASYEAMRTVDMYLIRQIARTCMVS